MLRHTGKQQSVTEVLLLHHRMNRLKEHMTINELRKA